MYPKLKNDSNSLEEKLKGNFFNFFGNKSKISDLDSFYIKNSALALIIKNIME